MPEEMHHFFVTDFPGELIDVVALIDELANVATYVTNSGFGSDDSFESTGNDWHVVGSVRRLSLA
jgi:hypothetical protein